MPAVLRGGPHRFFFYSGDGDEPQHVRIIENTLRAELSDRRTVSVLLAWYPRSVHASRPNATTGN